MAVNWKTMPVAVMVAAMVIVGTVFAYQVPNWNSPKYHSHPRADDSGATTAGTLSVVNASNAFALELYANLSAKDNGSNIFFSPYSISTNMAMVYEGARGQTASEIRSVLHFPQDNTTRRSSFAALYNNFTKADVPHDLDTANALWIQDNWNISKEYTNLIQRYYSGESSNVDFSAPEQARQTINRWVETETNNKIKDIIPPDTLDASTCLVLTNAIYFKGAWQTQFDKSKTIQENFRVNDNTTVTVPIMKQSGQKIHLNYAETNVTQIIELPYLGAELSMYVLLPKNYHSSGIVDLEKSLTAENLSAWLQGMSGRDLSVSLPKFTFAAKYYLNDTLSDMGMPTAFSSGCDLSGICNDTTQIKYVIHQSFVDVNEEGTEAAAATATAVQRGIEIPESFYANHPFIFIIRDRTNGAILFMGKVMDPTKTA